MAELVTGHAAASVLDMQASVSACGGGHAHGRGDNLFAGVNGKHAALGHRLNGVDD